MVELALYPTDRDVYAHAEQPLRTFVQPIEVAVSLPPPSPAAPRPLTRYPTGDIERSRYPEEWMHGKPVEAARRFADLRVVTTLRISLVT